MSDYEQVPVFLGATAGMRMLDPSLATTLIANARTNIKTWGFTTKDEWINILSGEQEGVYGWVALNYLLGNFNEGATETVGALDMGGASAQYTFKPT